ncbi:general stress protein [Bombiscardovia nodaiensis]|uniref:General stress protein n=1 Tax=Bombiscardovia nodaiensis TaxID=2932181 RepID=A0ABN6SC87_9BIFI|nr:general stress protein [Bombiscardovia nodaiensis]
MKTAVLAFHPHLGSGSRVTHRLAQAAQSVDGVSLVNEYQLYPDFHIDVAAEQETLLQADRIVWLFPFYWYSSPALLKQWEDDVLEHGWAYGSDGDRLHGKEFMLAISIGSPAEKYRPEGEFAVAGKDLLTPFRATARLIGVDWQQPFLVHGASFISDEDLEQAAQQFALRLQGPGSETAATPPTTTTAN